MKRVKKLMALVIAVAMVLAMGVSVFAADHTVSTTSSTHTYEIYQVFTGDYDAASNQLQNLKYGQNAKTGTTGESVSATDMKALDTIAGTEYANDQAKIAALSPYVDFETTPIAVIGKEGTDGATSVSLPEGYYIIKDKDESLEDPETYTLYMFQVLGDDIEIQPKDGTTTVDKTVTETNDTTGDVTPAQKGADYDEGDSIPYSIDIKLAKNVTDYKTYTATLTDTLSSGLTPPAASAITVTIKDKDGNTIDGTNIPGYTAPAASVSGQTITVTFSAGNGTDAIGSAGSALNEAVINVSYEAVLNENAVVGVDGNPNTYTITYSNNPNGDDTGTTPEQKVIVYTYELEIEKKDSNDAPLAGAGFTLYKVVTEDYPGAQTGAAIKEGLADGVIADKLDDDGYYVPISMTEAVTEQKVTHKVDKTIDAGDYVLIETTVPDGYNAYAGEEISITSTISAEGKLTGLTATPTTLTVSSDFATVSGEVENQSGAELPTTGGMGTTIFYIVGAILVIGGGILLISKRRMHAE